MNEVSKDVNIQIVMVTISIKTNKQRRFRKHYMRNT